jgi:protein SCO1/2
MGLLNDSRYSWMLGLILLVLAVGGCQQEDGAPGTYTARGTVEDVDIERAQVLIDHGDVVGLMPGMTMNFSVPDADVLAALEPGQIVDFDIDFTGRSYEVSRVSVVGEAPAEAGWRRLGEGLVRTSTAPPFELTDQAGRTVSLASLGDRVLLVDFIYTECPGPCPVQTSNQVAFQKRIPEAWRDRVHFVSISLDPEVDRPEVLERYAIQRGAELSNWSFLTGERESMAALVQSWGVGSLRREDGSIDHTLITFLVHRGRVMQRYTARGQGDDKMLEDVLALADASAAGGADAPPVP